MTQEQVFDIQQQGFYQGMLEALTIAEEVCISHRSPDDVYLTFATRRKRVSEQMLSKWGKDCLRYMPVAIQLSNMSPSKSFKTNDLNTRTPSADKRTESTR